jgi:hypothetical protein
MATNLAIDPDLLERALEVSGERTKKAAVTRALQEFIARREQARILGLFGTVEIDPEYNYKAERWGRTSPHHQSAGRTDRGYPGPRGRDLGNPQQAKAPAE